jgi:hypothetical protein
VGSICGEDYQTAMTGVDLGVDAGLPGPGQSRTVADILAVASDSIVSRRRFLPNLGRIPSVNDFGQLCTTVRMCWDSCQRSDVAFPVDG